MRIDGIGKSSINSSGVPWEAVPGKHGTEITATIGQGKEPTEIQETNVGEEIKVVRRCFRTTRQEACQGCARAMSGEIACNRTAKCTEIFEKRLM